MEINGFSLAWRWTSPSHGNFPDKILNELTPLTLQQALELSKICPINFPVGAKRFDSTVSDKLTSEWLSKIVDKSARVTISWDKETALSLPWFIFCEYWDDFCYPSSDDADFFYESGDLFLRWNHYEIFEYDPSAI